ncbi:unnamed protein product [Mucor circinelloides]
MIKNCNTTFKSCGVTLANTNVGLHRASFPIFDLYKVTRRPQVKTLHVSSTELTTRVLKYIMHKLTGLTKLIIECESFDNIEPIDKRLANNYLSLQTYLDAFEYMISLDYFEARRLSIASSVRELQAFWAKRPQLKALTISGTPRYPREVFSLLVMNTERELNKTALEYKEDGACEMKLDIQYQDYTTSCKQTLEQFSGNTIEDINMFSTWNTVDKCSHLI